MKAPANIREAGREFTRGGLDALLVLAGGLCLLALVSNWAGDALKLRSINDSDASRSHRSSMSVRRDALTGCEYLESTSGHLTPRLGADGRQVCRQVAR